MKKRTKKHLKRRLLIGLAAATLGYLCMQEALLVQDMAGEAETVDPMRDRGFRNTAQKQFTWNPGVQTEDFRNTSNIPLSFTSEEKAAWDEIVDRMNSEIKTIDEEIKKIRGENVEERTLLMKERRAHFREEWEKEREFAEKQAAPLKQEADEIREKSFPLFTQLHEMMDNIDPEATEEELNLTREKAFNLLTKEILPIRKKLDQLWDQRNALEYDFKTTDEFRKIFDKRFELEVKTARVMREERALRKAFREKEKAALLQLYPIFKSARAKDPDKKLEFPDEIEWHKKMEAEMEEEEIKEKMEKDPLVTEVKKTARSKGRRRR